LVARLVALTGDAVFAIHGYPAGVGRRPDNAIVINDPYISGRHAELVETDSGIAVRDLGSTNGTIVESEPLAPNAMASIAAGAVVQFGKARFRFEPVTSAENGETVESTSQTAEPSGAMTTEGVPTPVDAASGEPINPPEAAPAAGSSADESIAWAEDNESVGGKPTTVDSGATEGGSSTSMGTG